jgi:ferrous iron transport protein A
MERQIDRQSPLIKTLAMLSIGEIGIIEDVVPSELSSKLVQMGFLPGKKVAILRTTFTGTPLYLQLGEQYIALRREEAALLIIKQ